MPSLEIFKIVDNMNPYYMKYERNFLESYKSDNRPLDINFDENSTRKYSNIASRV